jgi:hypothetical protein
MTTQTPVPLEQKEIDVHGDPVVALRTEDGLIWVPIRHMCEALGVDRVGQLQRIQRDPVLSKSLTTLPITLSDGRTYEMDCLPLKYIRGWLFGINASRVKEAIRDKLIRYQEEVIEIIDRAFSRDLPSDPLDEAMIEALRENAMQQAQLWDAVLAERRRLRATEQLVQELDDRVSDHDRLLSQQGQVLGRALDELASLREEQSAMVTQWSGLTRLLPAPSDPIGPAEKAAIKALVDDLVAAAQERGIRLGQGRNDYPAVWDAFKRRWDLAKYDELPRAHYEEAVAWLKSWLDRIRQSNPSG